MRLRDLFIQVEDQLNTKIFQYSLIQESAWSSSYKLETDSGTYFLKNNISLPELFQKEAAGLRLLNQNKSVNIPEIICIDTHFLLLEYIDQISPNKTSQVHLGQSMAALHKEKQALFGLPHDNFIGSLPQYNKTKTNWQEFFWKCRLEPQLSIAFDAGKIGKKHIDQTKVLALMTNEICPQEAASLCHGDFWNGNFIVDEKNKNYLIDPAVSYAHREMDIAMSCLFGGFSEQFYAAYINHYPLQKGWEERMDFYQLYYLLVHVNLFGSSYLGSVSRVLKKYTT